MGFLQNLFINRLKSLVLDKIAELKTAYLNGDHEAVEGIINWIASQIGYKPDLEAVAELVMAIGTGDTGEILDEIGDAFKQAATHFKAPKVGAVGDADDVLVAFADVQALTAPRVAATPEGQKTEGIMEVIAIVQLIAKLAQWVRNRKNV